MGNGRCAGRNRGGGRRSGVFGLESSVHGQDTNFAKGEVVPNLASPNSGTGLKTQDALRGPGRPRLARRVSLDLEADYFKPAGIPMRDLEMVSLTLEETEALRLADLEDLEQEDAAKKMGVSRRTFWRELQSARKKTADALVNGKAIKIEKS